MTRGCITYGGHCFPDHNGTGFGTIGYEDALSFSSNTFFYQIGVGVGSIALHNAALSLGFTKPTGIEIGYEESRGLVGNERWAAQGRGWAQPGSTPWIPEDMASMSIGQSVVQITPLQLARAYAVFANGGYLITPHLVDQGLDWTDPPRRTKVAIKPSTLATVARGLRKVVSNGTGAGMNVPNLPPVAGKTGTAEDSTGGPDHAWFACFAPTPMERLWWWPLHKTHRVVVRCMPCRWRGRCWRCGISCARAEGWVRAPGGSSGAAARWPRPSPSAPLPGGRCGAVARAGSDHPAGVGRRR